MAIRFWLFAWTSSVLRHEGLEERDFDFESVDVGFDIRIVPPDGYVNGADGAISRGMTEA